MAARGSRAAVRLLLAVAALVLAASWRWPYQVQLRPWLLWLPAGTGLLAAFEVAHLRRRGPGRLRAVAVTTALAAALSTAGSLGAEARFRWIRHRVLTAEPERLARLGRHLVVGYRDRAEVEGLLRRRAAGGVFVSWWNARGRSAAEVAGELTRLRALRAATGEAPLWIAADQEGGRSSRLSPPLPPEPPLRAVAASCGAEGCPEVARFARLQAAGLQALGVNLDLAPVVDLDHHLLGAGGRFTRIEERSVGSDPALVARVAGAYCAALVEAGVACTLKHFPGLGRVAADTHRRAAALVEAPGELTGTDWVPYREAAGPGRLVMLAHAELAAVDPGRPASTSRAVVELVRELAPDAPIITDDFGMMALFGSRGGVGQAAVDALGAGVDLVLVSYDPDLYYPAMDALLRADRDGRLDRAVLRRSEERLDRAARALGAGRIGR